MWPFKKLYNKTYLEENGGLHLTSMVSYYHRYGDKIRYTSCTAKKWAKMAVTKHFKGEDDGKRSILLVMAQWNGKFFPVVDTDSDVDFAKAGLWLDEQGITYSVIKSANNHWYIVDKEYTKRGAIDFAKMIPGNDKDYVHSSTLMLRMSLKDGSDRIPRVVTIGNETAEFVNAIEKFLSENENLLRYVDRFVKFHHGDKVFEDAGENKYGISIESIMSY